MPVVAIVSTIAISGETSATAFDRSARFSSTSCIGCFLFDKRASAHQEAEFFPAGIGGFKRLGERSVEHHRDPVGDFEQLVKVLARDENGSAAGRKVDQS